MIAIAAPKSSLCRDKHTQCYDRKFYDKHTQCHDRKFHSIHASKERRYAEIYNSNTNNLKLTYWDNAQQSYVTTRVTARRVP